MITSLLIANRGEIACRIARTAKARGLRVIAVYSEADRDALHVAAADEAYPIGPAPAAESYLRIDRLLEAAARGRADAVHPGYGFLSENAAFAEAVLAAGLVWVGPPPAAIRAMGLKDEAKRRMAEAGVPLAPGYHGADQSDARLAAEAERIGWPVLVKARAGGGGKGMRKVAQASEFAEALARARSEAAASFGDDGVILERYVTRARHLEVQVLADAQGGVVHLFERDCSLQRRHQKVIEEAPAPGVTPELRATLGAAAVRAAKAVGYVGAGTVEFLADVSDGLRADRIYFMEMNTRLQVEHPVTEAITGLDLVALQLAVADGEALPFAQADLAIDGWAVEARLYAEEPAAGFRPAAGRIHALCWPEGVRVDAGVRAGDAVTPFYDPMLAKLIAHGPTRAAAIGRLARALADTRLSGLATNRAFLGRLLATAAFRDGAMDTGLIETEGAALSAEPGPSRAALVVAALAAVGRLEPSSRGDDPWDALVDFRLWGAAVRPVRLSGAAELEARVTAHPDGRLEVALGEGPAVSARVVAVTAHEAMLEIDGVRLRLGLMRGPSAVTIVEATAEHAFRFDAVDAAETPDDAADDVVRASMPALVRRVAVTPGEAVTRGQPLVTLEAMKMEMTLGAPRDGVVAAVEVAAGDRVEEGAALVALAPQPRSGDAS